MLPRSSRRRSAAPLKPLLVIPRLSDSIDYRVYLETLGSVPFLRWWAERFAERHPQLDLSVVCQTERQESEVRQALASGTARIIRIEAGTTLRCLARVAGMFPGCNIAVLPFGFAYAPADLLSRASAHHLREGNNYTQVLGLPRGAAPEIYSPDVLIKLSELRLPGLPTAPGQALEAILRATSAASVQPPLPIHARPFMADADYAATPHQLPERVVIEGPEDIEVARRVDSLRHTDTNPLGELHLWREVSVAQSMEDRRLFAALAPRPRRRISALAPPLRILYVSYPSAFSGGEQSLVQLVSNIDRRRFEPFCLIGVEGLLAQRLRRANAHVTLCGAYGGRSAEDALFLAGVIGQIKPHLLHLNAPSGPLPVFAPLLWGIPVVSHLHTAETRGYEAQIRVSDAIIAVSDFVRREALKLEIRHDRVHVVHNGVDIKSFRPNMLNGPALRKKLGIPEAAKVVLTIARFSPGKRHDVLLQAARLAKSRLPDLFLVLNGEVFGESPAYDAASDLIDRHCMRDWVRIIPFVEEIRELHSVADILVLCSEREGLGQCVIEAMAMGVPVVVADSGGLPEIIEHGETGLIVPPGNSRSLAAQIVNVFASSRIRSRITRAARCRVEESFDARAAAQRIMAIYDQILRNKAGGRSAR